MPDALICPKCAAEVQYRDAVGADLECPRCHTPLVPERSGSMGGASTIPDQYRQSVEKALQLAQAAGYLGPLPPIQAIKFYRQATGASLADAKRVIDSVGPLSVGLATGQGTTPLSGAGRKSGNWLGVLVIIAMVSAAVGGIFALVNSRSGSSPPTTSPPPIAMPSMPSIPSIPKALLSPTSPQFATMTMEFGSQGVGPAHFDDARAVAVDNQGHIYVGEYSNGRVQVFDTTGKYLSEFSLGANSYLQNLIADRKGMVYAVSSSHILCFTGATGAAQSEMENSTDGVTQKMYTDACLAPGGAMYAISSRGGDEPEIVKLDIATGKIVSTFDTKKSVGESLDLFRIVALTTGEIYALDREKGVFKFSADGRYINRFGGGKTAGVSPLDLPPSQLFSPLNIAVDSQGRIYVCDAGSCIKVYDKDGNYLDKFGGHEVAFGIAIDDDDNIYAGMRNRHSVRKFVISKR